MTSYSNYFSENLVQSNQNNGQNISLTKPVSTFGWTQNDQTDFVMSKIINIVSATEDSSTIKLATVNQQELFTDVIIVNRTDKKINIQDLSGKTISILAVYKSDIGENSGYFYTNLNGWDFLPFGTEAQTINVDPLVGHGLFLDSNDKINQAVYNKYVNQKSYDITSQDLAKFLVFNAGNTISGDINFNLPSYSTDLPDGFFLYISNVNSKGNFSVTPGKNDTINNNSAGKIFNLKTNTSVLFVLNISTDSNNNNINSWFTVLNSPRTKTSSINAFMPAEDSKTQDYTLSKSDNAKTIIMNNNRSSLTLHLPDPKQANIENGYIVNVVNIGQAITLSSNNSIINSGLRKLRTGQFLSYQLVSDGINWFTIGLGDSNGLVTILGSGSSDTVYLNRENFGEVFIAPDQKLTFNLSSFCMYPGAKCYFSTPNTGYDNNIIMLKADNPARINKDYQEFRVSGGDGQGIVPVCLTMDVQGDFWAV